MTLPISPKHYQQRDQNEIRRIITGSTDDMIRRILELEAAPVDPEEPPTGTRLGRPFGAFGGFASNTSMEPLTQWFNWTNDPADPGNVITRLNTARDLGFSASMFLAGGGKANYLSGPVGAQKFDKNKWKARYTLFNTPTIKARIADAVGEFAGDTELAGLPGIDEAYHHDWDETVSGEETSAGLGVMNKALLDELATHAKSIFPTAPIGYHGGPIYTFDKNNTFEVVDYVLYQYQWKSEVVGVTDGDIDGWIAGALAQNAADGVKSAFSINIRNGGIKQNGCCKPADNCTQAQKEACCPQPLTGGVGAGAGAGGQNCKVTATQLEVWGKKLLDAGALLGMWDWVTDMMSRGDMQNAFEILEAYALTKPRISVHRS